MSSSWPDPNEYSLMRDCPKCGAKKYDPCTTKKSGKELLNVHKERKKVAEDLAIIAWHRGRS